MSRILSESFDVVGYDNTWTETVGSENSLDSDTIPTTESPIPGTYVLQASYGTSAAAAYATYDSGTTNDINYVRAYINILNNYGNNYNSIDLIMLEDDAGVFPISIRYQYSWDAVNGFTHTLRAERYDAGYDPGTYVRQLSLNTWYCVEMKYDYINSKWGWKLDGVAIDNDLTLSTPTDNCRYLHAGLCSQLSSSRTGEKIDIQIDGIEWDNYGWIGEYTHIPPGSYIDIGAFQRHGMSIGAYQPNHVAYDTVFSYGRPVIIQQTDIDEAIWSYGRPLIISNYSPPAAPPTPSGTGAIPIYMYFYRTMRV